MNFLNIIVIGDIHNDVESITNYVDKLSSLDFEVIICPGDFIDIPPRGFTERDLASLIIEELRTFKKPIVAVPGNLDGKILQVLEEEKISIHGKGKIIGDVGFYGFGGARTPFKTSLEPSEEEIKIGLERGFEEVKNAKYKIQVTHIPPINTKIDRLYTGAHVGSETVRKFIEKNKPNVAISAHVHEARGVDELGETKLLNAGRFPEGSFGFIEIKNEKTSVRLQNLI